MTRAPLPDTSALRRRLWALAAALAAILALAAAWSWSPLREWLDVQRIVGALQSLGRAFGPLAVIAGFGIASALAVPLVFLTLVVIIAFGPWLGAACALSGALIGAAASHGLGALLGREAVLRLGGAKVNAVSTALARRGLLAIVAVRLVPIAPFAVVNIVAGATQIRLSQMLLGTAIGIAPSTVAMMLFVDQILRALQEPSPLTGALVALTVGLIALGLWGFRAWLRRQGGHGAAQPNEPPR